MKNLGQIKNEVAIGLGYNSFLHAMTALSPFKIEDLYNEVSKRYAKQACENLKERIAQNIRQSIEYKYGHVTIDKNKILNTEIILP